MEHPVRQYFSFDVTDQRSTCLIEGCGIKLTGKHAANLTRHMQYSHPNEFAVIRLQKENGKKRRLEEASSSSTTSLDISEKTLINACVELVTKNGRPLSIVSDSGFRKIIDPLLKSIKSCTAINTSNIREAVKNKALEIKNQIRDGVKNQLISVKIDGATRQFRSFLGINIQYILYGKIVVRTISLTEMFTSHTSDNLKNVVLNVLKEYGVDIGNIYTITTDNGANMLKMIRLTEEEQQTYCENENGETDDDFLNDYNGEFYLEGQQLFHSEDTNFQIIGVRCVAHTLQLAINDALKAFGIEELLQKTRDLIKKLRTSSISIILKTMKLKRPILDCATRWNSTIHMLERLVELKDVCKQLNENSLVEDEWTTINELILTLAPAKVATTKMQYEQMTMGDFYAVWLQCKLNLNKVQNHFANILSTAINKRERELLNNKSLLANVFLDPRFKNLLSEDEKGIAISQLISIWKRYKSLNSTDTIETRNEILAASSISSHVDDFEQLLLEKDTQIKNNETNAVFNITAALNAFSEIPRIDRHENILQYWHNDKHGFPELRKLAKIVHAVPATQVSVERLFSGLKFILNDHRSRLNHDTLDDIMVVRTNEME